MFRIVLVTNDKKREEVYDKMLRYINKIDMGKKLKLVGVVVCLIAGTCFWTHQRKIPQSFYDGTTGIAPIDKTIKKILKTGYAHHIERLMILANFMNLCEFHPDDVYRWCMEMFIDAYDWVMVPNVYGMSLFADGGIMSTKPYISGSNYLKKMSDYSTENWGEIWDSLFWNFISKNQEFFRKNPRLSMMLITWNKMTEQQKELHLVRAQNFLEKLDQ